MRFEWPLVFWLLPLLILWLWRAMRRPNSAITFSSLQLLTRNPQSWRTRLNWLPETLGVFALIFFIGALARPQIEAETPSTGVYAVAIELLVDLSSSMSTPIKTSSGSRPRIDVVKEVLPRFILGDGKTLQGRHNDLMGLVTFARYADTVSPQTTAHDALAEMIRNLELESRPNEDGTAYGDAVTLAAARLHTMDDPANRRKGQTPVKSRVIVLLTDGENNCGRHLPLEATALAKKWGIRVYVISLGEDSYMPPPAGAPPPPPSTAQVVLERMANETGGVYRRAQDEDSLLSVYKEIDRLERSEIRLQTHIEWRELFPWFIAIGMVFLLAKHTLRSTVLLRIP